MSADLRAARADVAQAARRLAQEGLVVGTAGNVSARAGELVAITATGTALEEIDERLVTVIDLNGDVVEGELAPTSEINLHLGIYRRYDAGAVVHTHARFATALSCVLDELPMVHYHLLLLGGPVRVAPYRTFGSSELAEVTLEALEGRLAALMSNHGAITHADDLKSAIDQMLVLEWACEVYWRAAAIGTPRTLDEAQQQAVVAKTLDLGYGRPQARDQMP